MNYDDDSKYFDPATNDFLPQPVKTVAEPDPDPDLDGLDPEARRILEVIDLTTRIEDSRVPFATAAELSEAADVEASDLGKDIARLYPGRNEIELDGITVVRMMSGNFQVNGFPLRELSAAYLGRLRAAVRLRRY